MDKQARKAAVAEYKDKKPAYGVFAVICEATGETWVGQSLHVDTQQNGLWFSLKLGKSPYSSLQAAWNFHGQKEFKYEELDRLSEDFPSLNRAAELKRRRGIWQTRLNAFQL